ncbi:hypothetical protein FH5_00804 [Priestia endophytica]|nr:hypothetical protein FH5_00804 [Priestia endophytica]
MDKFSIHFMILWLVTSTMIMYLFFIPAFLCKQGIFILTIAKL